MEIRRSLAIAIGCLAFGAGCTDEAAPQGRPGSEDSCVLYDAPIGPVEPPRRIGYPPDPIVRQEIAILNHFWGSRVEAFIYGPDQPEGRNNALASPDGYIYYDPAFLAMLDGRRYSYAPSQMIMAHEVGHELQFGYDTITGEGFPDEQGADCLAGFFIGWLACTRSLTDDDVMADFDTMCDLGDDNQGLPWWSSQDHGTCAQRTSAFERGVRAYEANRPPLNACLF